MSDKYCEQPEHKPAVVGEVVADQHGQQPAQAAANQGKDKQRMLRDAPVLGLFLRVLILKDLGQLHLNSFGS